MATKRCIVVGDRVQHIDRPDWRGEVVNLRFNKCLALRKVQVMWDDGLTCWVKAKICRKV
jgi:hypothetical protein